jgi:hypothetical protein
MDPSSNISGFEFCAPSSRLFYRLAWIFKKRELGYQSITRVALLIPLVSMCIDIDTGFFSNKI